MNLIALGAIGVALYLIIMLSGVHRIQQGQIGLYKRFGVLSDKTTKPGIHFSIPFIYDVIPMNINLQTDTVTNIPCGTSNGTMIYFERIEVVNRLNKKLVYETVLNYTQNYEKFWITDKIHSQINQFCSKHSLQEVYIDIFDTLDEQIMSSLNKDLKVWAPGIQILSVRVTKPKIPQRIKKNFQQMEKIKIDYYIAVEKQHVRNEQVITEQKQKIIQQESLKNVKVIQLKKKIQIKENDWKMAVIEGQIIFEKQKAQIDTQFLVAFQEAQLNPKLYTQSYLSYLAADAFTTNTTFIVGDKIPQAMIQQKKYQRVPFDGI